MPIFPDSADKVLDRTLPRPGRVSPKLPAIRPRLLARAVEHAGFVLRNVSGRHHRYVHPEDPASWTVVPMHNRDLKPGTLRAILHKRA